MDYFLDYEHPDLEEPIFLYAFAGWADAAQSATHALRYLVNQLGAVKFASVDPEEFYDFTQARPHTAFNHDGNRVITWPSNELFAWKGGPAYPDLAVLIGTEPSLRWRTFAKQVVSVVNGLSVSRVVHVGALLDTVPHTREPRITGTGAMTAAQAAPSGVEMRRSRYTGPTGITGVVADALRGAGLSYVSLWGHTPHYLQVAPNPKVSLGLARAMGKFLQIEIDLEPLRSQGKSFDRKVVQALTNEPEVTEYVRKLEMDYDRRFAAAAIQAVEMPEPADAVRDMEEFLKQLRGGPPSSQDSR